ncbi:MAG TPA: hypothetical protein VNL98_10390 [Gemmatimonadales bacterium]|nr:hypothetical protein [Gemmatimonadales bacterium]
MRLAVLGLLAVLALAAGLALPMGDGSSAAAQLLTPTPTFSLFLSPLPLTPLAPPLPRTIAPGVPYPFLQATATAAAATITAADATATARVGVLLTSVAATATALAQPTSTPTTTPSPSPTRTLTPSPTATVLPATPTATAPPSPTATPLLLTAGRTVLTTASIAVGDEVLPPGTPLTIPVDVMLQDGAIPSGTVIRLPDGQLVTLPAGITIPVVEQPTTVTAPLNAVLPQASLVGDTPYPANTTVVLPVGTTVLGSLEPNATVLLPAGTVVQVAGHTHTLVEPLRVVISPAPVAQPVTLPATGDAAPILWPAAVGVLLMLLGWRLYRTA